jgi:hypothetical protein
VPVGLHPTSVGFQPLGQHGNNRGGAVTLQLERAEVLALYGFLALGSHFEAAMSGENSPLSSEEVRTHTAAISSYAASTLIEKISEAVVEILKHISNEAQMNEQPNLPPQNGGHYRNLAGRLRLVARECRFPNARQELLDLAARYERRADHFDGHSQ